jgi:pimeloyl-ACP methyl ester carboxylesterase
MKEQAILFGKTRSLVGILTEPAVNKLPQLPAVILLNAGLIHRIGPNRLYVKIARRLAQLGFTVLRFDLSGIGDSKAREDHLPYLQSMVEEIHEAMDYLTRVKGCQRFLLSGHCAGAGMSFKMAAEDERVIAAILINSMGQGDAWSAYDRNRKLAKFYTNYYGKSALSDSQRWLRFVKGQVDYRSIGRNLFQNILWNRVSSLIFRIKLAFKKEEKPQLPPGEMDPAKSLNLMAERGVKLLFIYNEGSSGLEYARMLLRPEFDRLLAANKIQLAIIPETDHLFTLLTSQDHLLKLIQEWLQEALQEYQEMTVVSSEVKNFEVSAATQPT